jgi:hypothetical protein
MRYLILAAGLSLAVAGSLPANAESGGPMTGPQGQCRTFNSNHHDETFSYWQDSPCVSTETRRGGVGRRIIRSTINPAGIAHLENVTRTRYGRRPVYGPQFGPEGAPPAYARGNSSEVPGNR